MSDQNPYEKLGVTEDASFDEIQDAKGRLVQQYRGDPKLLETVEAAYDAIIMDRLRMRQEGKIKVPERIRFPERLPQTPLSVPEPSTRQSPAWLQRLLDRPTSRDIIAPAVVFLVLSGLTIGYPQESILPLVVALGFGSAIYFINRKEQQFGRAVLLTLVGLLIGVGIGMTLATPLQAQIDHLRLTSEKFASLLTFLLFWLMSTFLR